MKLINVAVAWKPNMERIKQDKSNVTLCVHTKVLWMGAKYPESSLGYCRPTASHVKI